MPKNLKLVDEEIKIHDDLRPKLATRNKVRLDLRTMVAARFPDKVNKLVLAGPPPPKRQEGCYDGNDPK